MPCRFRQNAGRNYPYVASVSMTECQASHIVGGTEANIVVVVGTVVVPVAVEHASVRPVVPVASSNREKHFNNPALFGLRR